MGDVPKQESDRFDAQFWICSVWRMHATHGLSTTLHRAMESNSNSRATRESSLSVIEGFSKEEGITPLHSRRV